MGRFLLFFFRSWTRGGGGGIVAGGGAGANAGLGLRCFGGFGGGGITEGEEGAKRLVEVEDESKRFVDESNRLGAPDAKIFGFAGGDERMLARGFGVSGGLDVRCGDPGVEICLPDPGRLRMIILGIFSGDSLGGSMGMAGGFGGDALKNDLGSMSPSELVNRRLFARVRGWFRSGAAGFMKTPRDVRWRIPRSRW